jgi:hypothetical protein
LPEYILSYPAIFFLHGYLAGYLANSMYPTGETERL